MLYFRAIEDNNNSCPGLYFGGEGETRLCASIEICELGEGRGGLKLHEKKKERKRC